MRLCAICAGQGKSCCIGRDILLSDGDLKRITGYTGLLNFFEMRPPRSAAYLDQEDDPNWNIFTLKDDGLRRVVKHTSPGICTFLTDKGCQLPEDIRPLVCRLHPAEFTEEKVTGLSDECMVEHLPAGESLLTNLQMNPDKVENWRQQLYTELRREHRRGHIAA